MATHPSRFRKQIAALSLVAAGMAGGGVLASTVAANAADSTPSTPSTTSSSAAAGSSTTTQQSTADQSKSQGSDEKLLTGTDAQKARAAALAKYPGATIQRVETDSDGVYEAHIVTADGQRLIVQMDANFAVTGTDSGGPGGSMSGAAPSSSTSGTAAPSDSAA